MTTPGAAINYPGQPISPNLPASVNLQSGGIFNIPSGNFMLKIGPQCAVQWNDDDSGLWRILDSGPTNHPLIINSDGSNFRVINLSGTISGANITTPGTLYTQAGTTIAFGAPAAGTPSRTAAGYPIIGGSLTFTVVSGGTGYSNPMFLIQPPTLCGAADGFGIQATIAACTVTAGVISAPTGGFAGAGYIIAPTVTVIDAVPQGNTPGTGAVITASIANGTATSGGLTGVVMTDPGAGYDGTHIPTITVTGPSGNSGTAAATALPNMALKSVTPGGTNTGYTASIVGITNLGTVAGTPVAVNDEFVMPRPGRFSAAQSGGVLGTPVIEDAGIGFQTVPLAKQVGNATADGSVNATFTAVVGGVNNTLLLWQIG